MSVPLVLIAAIVLSPAILVVPVMAAEQAGGLCNMGITQAETLYHIPEGFLAAMGRVESGRSGPDGRVEPWPWTVTAAGTGHYYDNMQEAIDAVRLFRSQGIESIDVGCLQVNLHQHPDAFSNLEEAFSPAANARYAAIFLRQMYDHAGSWPGAAAAYHSQTPGIGTPYQWKVLEAWATPDGDAARTGPNKVGRRKNLLQKRSPLWGTGLKGQSPYSTPLASAAPALPFHNFSGGIPYLPPPSHHVMMKGRTLASYRAAPVMLAAPLDSQRH